MTVKSIVDVDVNDAAFAKFQALFEKYQAALAKTPGQWASVNAAAAGTALTVESLVAGLAAHNAATKAANAEQKKAETDAKKRAAEQEVYATRWERRWHSTATYAKDFSKSIAGATTSILRWTTPLSIFAGLVGAGGLFGLDRLAGDVGSGRRASQGLGTSIGARQAFETDYGRLVDPSQFLGGVNESLTDVTQRYKLYGAGLSERDISGKDTVEVSRLLIDKLKELADRTPTAELAQVLKSRGLDQFASVQDLERLKATSPEELSSIGNRFGRDQAAFNLSDSVARKWQDLSVGLSAAKNNIEAAFVRGLVPLIPSITKLSESLAGSVSTFFSNPNLKEDVAALGKGIEDFAKYLGTPQFSNDVKTFADDVAYAARKIGFALQWLGLIPDGKQGISYSNGPGNVAKGALGGAVIGAGIGAFGGPIGAAGGAALGGLAGWLLRKDGTDVLLDSIRKAESNGNPRAVSPKGALGAYQMLPGTAKQYHVVNPFDEPQERAGARHYLDDLSKEFGGDIKKVLAAYNWGPGNLERDVRAHGADWEKFLPGETKAYIGKVLANAVKAGATITINNNTGGNAVVQGNQAAK